MHGLRLLPTRRFPSLSIALTLAAIVFSLSLSGQAQQEMVLYNFPGAAQGGYPVGSLVFDSAGNLYGTAKNYGNSTSGCNCGTVFELSPTAGGWQQTVLYAFSGSTDGSEPSSNLILDAAGNLYGTTPAGGNLQDCNGLGCGVVFQLSRDANGVWSETALYAFTGGTDGGIPEGGLVFDAAGNLYGTTYQGGIVNQYDKLGNGTVFELSPTSSGTWKESIVHDFGHNRFDGEWPQAGLTIDAKGILYGTTSTGPGADGSVFQVVPAQGGHWRENTLRYFNNMPDGNYPVATVLPEAAGNLYTTTEFGGRNALGAVVKLVRNGLSTMETVIHSFQTVNDGQYPEAGLTMDAAGNLYGTTVYGGAFGDGAVFKLAPNTDGTWSESVVWNFDGSSGEQPHAGMIFNANGNLYGTTQLGGAYGYGTVFEIIP